MARHEDIDNPSDASAAGLTGKRTGEPSAEGLGSQRRRLLSPFEDADSGEQTTGNAQRTTRADYGPGADKQAGDNLGALDESLMALLLPDSIPSKPESIGASPEQESTFPLGAETGPSSNVEGSVSASIPVRSDEASANLLPVSAGLAAAGSPQVRVQNVIASGCVVVEGRRSASLDLRRIAVSCRFAEYNPRKINACIVRLRKPKCTGLIFRSGKHTPSNACGIWITDPVRCETLAMTGVLSPPLTKQAYMMP